MPQLAPVTLTDRESTPVDHVFSPQEINDNVGILVNTDGVPVGNERLGVSLRYTGNRYKATITLQVPVVGEEVINNVSNPKILRTSYIEATFSFSNTSTLQERRNAVGMFADALGADQPLINAVLTKLESVY